MLERYWQNLLAGTPGSYVFDAKSYETKAAFERDLNRARSFCAEKGWHFYAIDDPRLLEPQAFFVQIDR